MATMTISDLPRSCALDYEALSAIRGAGTTGDWVLGAFVPYTAPVAAIAPIAPIVNFYQTNYIANNLTLETENINVNNSAANSLIAVGAAQENALISATAKAG